MWLTKFCSVSLAVQDQALLARKSEKATARYRFNVLVIDEAHRIKNSESKFVLLTETSAIRRPQADNDTNRA